MLCKKISRWLSALFLSLTVLFVWPFTSVHASALDAKPLLTLNIQQGPLGVTLTLKGKNFHPGQATLSYIDPQNVPGVFVSPSDSSILVQADGTFLSSN